MRKRRNVSILAEHAEYRAAIHDFPELVYYADDKQRAVILAKALRHYREPERTMRRDNLRKSIAAGIRHSSSEPAAVVKTRRDKK